ncbi:MAG: hypothetical protein SF182_12315 [Deltaproteobacteria bacterium]|nr:hypothetical protein [Deltaproteobacteria bacterium]
MARILLSTTIPYAEDDWHIGRFRLLRDHLVGLGHAVTARDRAADRRGDDRMLAELAAAPFDQLWLFAVDVGGGLTAADCAGILAFRARGGGLLATRDHQDLGACLAGLGTVGAAHHFHSVNLEPDPARRRADDQATTDISWPNYHTGANGDAQPIASAAGAHPLLRAADGMIRYLPAHPHEGAVGVPAGAAAFARVIARGVSTVSGCAVNLAVAFEGERDAGGRPLGRAVAQSTFHHFCDYNWDPRAGCPSFVTEPPGDGMLRDPRGLADTRTYVANLAAWLS